jgi:hypothetical protein
MLEVAIISIKCALRDDFPEFMEFYNARPWENNESDEKTDAPDADTSEEKKSEDAENDHIPSAQEKENEAVDGN